jgi:nicotinamide phosphoribosyltransferase
MTSLNPIFATDSYKSSHYLQDPAGTTGKFSYVEARSGDGTVFFGLQAILDKYLSVPITMEDVMTAKDFFEAHGLPFNLAGWTRIVQGHRGFMPVRIKAVDEGLFIPAKNVLMTVEATDPELPWVGAYLETLLLRVWYPTTVATRSYLAKRVIRNAMLASCDSLDGLDFKLHDFGARGVSSGESAEIGGMAHLVNFKGSDTIEGVMGAMKYYDTAVMPGFSIPASEHSTITAWGRENEVEAYRNMLKQFGKPGKIFAVVSDSYDIFNACDRLWGTELRQAVIDSGATLVIRPDSGDPVTVICKMLRILDARFGTTINSKRYRVLNHVRIIQGDGLHGPAEIAGILNAVLGMGFSADNIAFGMGGGLLQKCDRDTYGFAMKCSAVKVDGEWRDVFKDPITSSAKKSKKGRLMLVKSDGEYETVTEQEAAGRDNYLHTVYVEGNRFNRTNLTAVRANTEVAS